MNNVDRARRYPNLISAGLLTKEHVEAIELALKIPRRWDEVAINFNNIPTFSWFLVHDKSVAGFPYKSYLKVAHDRVLALGAPHAGVVIQVRPDSIGLVVDPVYALELYKKSFAE